MAKEREAKPISSFFKFTDIGDMAAGTIREFRKSQFGEFFVLSPAFLRRGRKGKVERYESAAITIASDMISKIDSSKDKGLSLSITFDDTEPTKKGSPKKLYKVLELEPQEQKQLASTADNEHRDEAYIVSKSEADDSGIPADDDDDDDLPW